MSFGILVPQLRIEPGPCSDPNHWITREFTKALLNPLIPLFLLLLLEPYFDKLSALAGEFMAQGRALFHTFPTKKT